MSTFFMLAIAAMYAGAAFFYGWEGKWSFAILTTCWGIGNAVLAWISR